MISKLVRGTKPADVDKVFLTALADRIETLENVARLADKLTDLAIALSKSEGLVDSLSIALHKAKNGR